MMRIPFWLILVGMAIGAGTVIMAGNALINPNVALVRAVQFDLDTITPNADGVTDITPFRYTLTRPARITMTLSNDQGQTFVFREDETRSAGDHAVLFSGVVDGYLLPDETIEGVIERRLIPDGSYTWTFSAVGVDRDEQESVSGSFTVREGDTRLPIISDFSIAPGEFTPNQDGITDRVAISVYLEKPADLRVYLLSANGERIFIAPREDIRQAGEAGRQEFDYEGGVDINADPPDDGTYQVIAEAQDAVGQRIVVSGELTIAKGGKPIAEIVGQPIGPDVVFITRPYEARFFSSAEGLGDPVDQPESAADGFMNLVVVPEGDLLVFRLTVENYGRSPIRTSGPPPGTVYDQTQLAASLGPEAFEQPGAWRVGIQCQTSETSYPWRWAIGTADNLVSEVDPATGNTYTYLMPGERSVVWGAIRMTEVTPTFNPQNCWAGLIHEGVGISVRNNGVGTRSIRIESVQGGGE